MTGPVRLLIGCLCVAAAGGPAAAQWPYLTEEASSLREGRTSLSVGVGRRDREREGRYHLENGRTPPAGVYWSIPELQGTLGVGSRAEVSFDYEYLLVQPDGSRRVREDSGDLRLWTKLGLVRGGRQDLSLRFGVKLPNSTYLGTNETDFFVAALYDLRAGGWVATANLGLGLITRPERNQSQEDQLLWGVSLRWQGSGDGFRGGVETAGANGPYGVKRQRDARLYAGVLGWQWGNWRLDGSLRAGVHDWAGWGWLAGVTWDR